MGNIILIIIALVSLFYLLWQILKRFPQLANIKVDNLPDLVAKRQKDFILKNRLERQSREWRSKLSAWLGPLSQNVANQFRFYYQKLKIVERDLRRRGYKKLSSAVTKSQAAESQIIEAKQLINKEEYKKAEEVLLDVLSLDQHNFEAYKLLSQVYRQIKEYAQAKETLSYLLKLAGDKVPDIYFYLADLARDRGDLRQAEEDYLRSIKLARENYVYYLSLAEVYQELDEMEKALEASQKALSLSPNNPRILDFLIKISIIMQDKALAKQYLNKLIEVNPENNKIADFTEQIDVIN